MNDRLISGAPVITGPTCKSCTFFVVQPRKAPAANEVVDLAAPQEGDCRESPPSISRIVVPDEQTGGFIVRPYSGFPITRSNWWCGRHPSRKVIRPSGAV